MAEKYFVACKTADIKQGESKIVEFEGKSIGVFNVKGEYYALLNFCPHHGGNLCEGPITGTALPTNDFDYTYGYEESILRCAWHGWEFDITSGKALVDKKMKAKTYRVQVQHDEVVVYIR